MIASSLEKMNSVSVQNLRKDLPVFDVGDTVKMKIKVKEADKVRIHPFEGTVIKKTGIGIAAAFTVRKISFGEGVERTFPVHSPVIEKIEIVSKGVIKRSKLYYLRDRLGKKARVQVDQTAKAQLMSAKADMLHYETQAHDKGLRFILGVDEAGRGPLAGPVVAAAVCLQNFDFKNTINDSKKMSASAREKAFHEIFEKAYVGIGMMSEKTIDMVNILNASHLAMEMAVKELIRRMPSEVVLHETFRQQVVLLIDGNIFRTQLPYSYQPIIGGDAKSLSIACASIVAKVYRDRILNVYDKIFPQYGFAKHKGYPTEAHRLAIKEHGSSIIHRKTFQGAL